LRRHGNNIETHTTDKARIVVGLTSRCCYRDSGDPGIFFEGVNHMAEGIRVNEAIREPDDRVCYLCDSVVINNDDVGFTVGLGFGMFGFEYALCHKCLKKMTAEMFWQVIFEGMGYGWPPKKKVETGKE